MPLCFEFFYLKNLFLDENALSFMNSKLYISLKMGNIDSMDFESCNFKMRVKISVWVCEKNINLIIKMTEFGFTL